MPLQSSRVFTSNGPSLRWWRGFRDRHAEISLRKPEFVDRGRVANATQDIIDDYFDTLQTTLREHGLENKPQCIYNCDEAAVVLNKSSERVLIATKSKHCHSLSQGSGQHISVLCCISASGSHIPPLIIYTKSLPAGKSYVKFGPPNASYGYSESGFIDRRMYADWFENTFLKHITVERPVILLQDGASAHISPELINLAISNDIILLCFPPKLTHILQPCDVAMFRKMKAEISKTMHQLKFLRGDMWIQKQNFPGFFATVMENTFTPDRIQKSFKDTGIHPLDKTAICQELVQVQSKQPMLVGTSESHASTKKQCNSTRMPTENQESTGTLCNSVPRPTETNTDEHDLFSQLESISESETSAPVQSEAVSENIRVCPPDVASDAIFNSLTPSKQKAYTQRYNTGAVHSNDSEYTTWRFLKRKAETTTEVSSPSVAMSSDQPLLKNPLVDAGLISPQLAKVLLPCATPNKHCMRIGKKKTTKARVLTSDEIVREIEDREQEKKKTEELKQMKSSERAKKRLFKEEKKTQAQVRHKKQKIGEEIKKEKEITKQKKAKERELNNRVKVFVAYQRSMVACKTFEELKKRCEAIHHDVEQYPVSISIPALDANYIDKVSTDLLRGIKDVEQLYPQQIDVYGDCLAITASVYLLDNKIMHVEARVRIVMELVLNYHSYLDDVFLKSGISGECTSRSSAYAMFSNYYNAGSRLTSDKIHELFQTEIMKSIKPETYLGIWAIHAVSSLLGAPVMSVYPGLGSVTADLNRIVMPRQHRYQNMFYIMWTSTNNGERTSWWNPNHFVPLLGYQEIEILHCKNVSLLVLS